MTRRERELRAEEGLQRAAAAMNDDKERESVRTVVVAALDADAKRVHPDGVYDCVAWADVANLVLRERQAARDEALEAAAEEADETRRVCHLRAAESEFDIAYAHAEAGRAADSIAKRVRALRRGRP